MPCGKSSILSPKNDEELVGLARQGSRTATETLLSRYRPLVESKARAYFLLGGEHEDVVQEGMIGLFKAIRDYRGDRLALFRGFADLCVTRHILSAVKTASRAKHLPLNYYMSFEQPAGPGMDRETSLLESLPDTRACDPLDHAIGLTGAALQVAAARGLLSMLEERVLDGYLEGKSYREMSNEMSCVPKTIDNALQRVKRKIESNYVPESAALPHPG
jgi:RNA polymerase sporulation-specific sigma factor